MTAAGCEVPLYFDRLAPCLYLTDVGMLSQQRGLYVTCREKDFSNKFYTLDYIDIEFDLLTEVADVDHANYFTRHLVTLRPPFKENEEHEFSFYRQYFFRYFLK